MSELKARHIVDVYDSYYAENPFGERSQVYLKSEADKVIADLKEKHKTEVKELLCLIRDKDNNFNHAFDSEEKELRRQKYKRCLAMAKLCRSVWAAAIFIPEKGGTDKQAARYMKWEKCWRSLADKFKDKEAK